MFAYSPAVMAALKMSNTCLHKRIDELEEVMDFYKDEANYEMPIFLDRGDKARHVMRYKDE